MTWLLIAAGLAFWLIREYTLFCLIRRPVNVHIHMHGIGDDGGGEVLGPYDHPPTKPEVDEAARFN